MMRSIWWFRRDLRSEDHPLFALEGEVLPIFIFDPHLLAPLSRGDRRVAMIFASILELKEGLRARGMDLALFYGDPKRVISQLLPRDQIVASGDYDPYARARDASIATLLPMVDAHDTYLFTPEQLLKDDGTPYLVFTPFYRHLQRHYRPPRLCTDAMPRLAPYRYDVIHCYEDDLYSARPITLSSIGFEPSVLQLLSPWDRLAQFDLGHYDTQRDRIDLHATSKLGFDLRFGRIGWRDLLGYLREHKAQGEVTEPFFRQLMFREFYAHMLYHFPHLSERNYRYTYAGIEDETRYERITTASTGYPIIDAATREILATGEMPNRMRMIYASFWTKHLLLPWQWGERFFARHLLDYDAASNILSWQWSAGTGIDPQPYFRIFNPYTQSARYDPDGVYVRRWLPELASLPTRAYSTPHLLAQMRPRAYAREILTHEEGRKRALEHYRING